MEDEMVGWHQWTWVWASSGRRWRTGKPGVLQSMRLQRVRHNLVTKSPLPCVLNWWCHPTISSSITLFSCLQSFPAPGSFQRNQFFCIRWTKYWSFSVSISPFNEYSGLISFRMDWLDLLAVQGTLKSLLQFKSINSSALSFLYSPTLTSVYDYWENHSLD